MDTPHRLSEDQNERIFQRYILPYYIAQETERLDHPTGVILGGQPGAGKTALLTSAEERLSTQGPTLSINGDELRPFHPAYSQLQREGIETAALHTGPDAGRWVEKLIEAGIERRMNLVVESTMRQPLVVERTLDQMKQAGYQTEAHVLAVHPRQSWQGVHARFEAMMADEPGSARMTPRAMHDAAVTGMITSVAHIEGGERADRMLVVARGGTVLHDSAVAGWGHGGAVEAVRHEHNRSLSRDELKQFNGQWIMIVQQMNERGASASSIEAVNQQANDDRKVFASASGMQSSEVLLPAKILPDLSPDEISQRAQDTPRAKAAQIDAENLSETVYGSRDAITSRLLDIAASSNPSATAVLQGRALEADPEAIAPLQGRAGGWLRGPDDDRRAAQSAVVDLAMALERYGNSVSYERVEITKAHIAEQKKMAVEIPAPSSALTAVLAAPAEERLKALQNAPEVAKELEKIMEASKTRLSQQERAEIVAGHSTLIMGHHDLRSERAERLSNVIQLATQLHEENHKFARQQTLTRTVVPVLTR